jgi:hypothetical protein
VAPDGEGAARAEARTRHRRTQHGVPNAGAVAGRRRGPGPAHAAPPTACPAPTHAPVISQSAHVMCGSLLLARAAWMPGMLSNRLSTGRSHSAAPCASSSSRVSGPAAAACACGGVRARQDAAAEVLCSGLLGRLQGLAMPALHCASQTPRRHPTKHCAARALRGVVQLLTSACAHARSAPGRPAGAAAAAAA